MKSPFPQLLVSGFTLVALLTVCGCGTAASTGSGTAPATSITMPAPGGNPATLPTATADRLAPGMSTTAVLEAMGRPGEIRPMFVEGETVEIWVYVRPGQPVTRDVTTGTEDVHYVDPISGRELVRQEPIPGYVTETSLLEVRLIMVRGSLASWTVIPLASDRSFN